MASNTRHPLLQSRLFAGLPPGSLAQLEASFQRQSYEPGTAIVRQGEPGDTLHLLENGHVKVLVRSESGDKAVVAILGPGDCFGELSLIDGAPRSATVETLSPVQTLVLQRDDFLAYLRVNPPVVERLLSTLAGRLRRTNGLAADLGYLDMPGLLAKTLLELAAMYGQEHAGTLVVDLRVTQGDLARMIGGRRQSVSKILGSFAGQGIVRREGQRLVILDPERLRQRIS